MMQLVPLLGAVYTRSSPAPDEGNGIIFCCLRAYKVVFCGLIDGRSCIESWQVGDKPSKDLNVAMYINHLGRHLACSFGFNTSSGTKETLTFLFCSRLCEKVENMLFLGRKNK